MNFLTHHPRTKLFLQSTLLIGYIIFTIIQCSNAIDRNLSQPSNFITTVTAELDFPNIANTIGFLYFFGGTICLMFGFIVIQAIISLIKDFKDPKYKALFDEFKGN